MRVVRYTGGLRVPEHLVGHADIPDSILHHKVLSPLAKVLWAQLAATYSESIDNPDLVRTRTHATEVECLGVTPNKFKKAALELSTAGLAHKVGEDYVISLVPISVEKAEEVLGGVI
jgi:hypothetical protein